MDRILQELSFEEKAEFEASLPFFLQIAAKETSQTFGYHGAPQEFRLFQDVLKVIFEERLGIQLPENFNFLRLPGEKFSSIPSNSSRSFLANKPEHIDPKLHRYALDYFLLRPINQSYGLQIDSKNFSDQAISEVEVFLDNIRKAQQALNNPFHQEIETFLFPDTLCKEISSQTGVEVEEILLFLNRLLIEEYQNSLPPFDDYLWEKFDVNLNFDGVLQEELDEYMKAYEARIKYVQELSGDWHEYFYYYYDATPESSGQVLSMVGPLFSGMVEEEGETCLLPYLNNSSYEGYEKNLEAILEHFCNSLGIEPGIAGKMLESGRRIIEATGNDNGVIFQFYDLSSDPQCGQDRCTYLSLPCGMFVYNAENLKTSSFVNGDLVPDSDTQVQIRMVIGNSTNLNPFGSIRMIRYDSLPEGTETAILDAIRSVLVEASEEDPSKTTQYRERLKQYWNF
ncbi:MAG: hypothetical protein JSR57_06535 [Verrucomicrobia bacterium]|nr:hypothetical protein [Verrucomicrobiota bacterium]